MRFDKEILDYRNKHTCYTHYITRELSKIFKEGDYKVDLFYLKDSIDYRGIHVSITKDRRNFLSFSIINYPICCGGSILMDVNYTYSVKDEHFKIIDDFVDIYMENRTISMCQLMSSYSTHKELHTALTKLGWQNILEYHNNNSHNECYIIVKRTEVIEEEEEDYYDED